MLISLAELAMLKNVSRAAVTKKIKSGKLEGAVVNHNGRKLVNKDEAIRLWDRADTRVVTTVKKELKQKIDNLSADEIPDFAESKAKREFYLAELAKLDVEEKKKQLENYTDFQKAVDARTQRLEDAYDNPSTAKLFGLNMFRQDVNPADAGFYVAEDMRIPQQRTMLGKMFQPQSPQEIMEQGYTPRTNIGILSNILGKADKFGTLPRADQAFITSQMGYSGPTVFCENTTGGSKDPFGLNVRSAFGNYAERVGTEVNKLGIALSDAGKVGSKYNATFNPETGLFEGEDADLANYRTKMLRTKLNFYREKI